MEDNSLWKQKPPSKTPVAFQLDHSPGKTLKALKVNITGKKRINLSLVQVLNAPALYMLTVQLSI